MKSVIICDMEGVIKEINKGALDLFGYDKDELVGRVTHVLKVIKENGFTSYENDVEIHNE